MRRKASGRESEVKEERLKAEGKRIKEKRKVDWSKEAGMGQKMRSPN
jgi:hypothetical protein